MSAGVKWHSGLSWFDPLTYKRADELMPAADPKEVAISRAAQRSRTSDGIKQAQKVSNEGHGAGWFKEADKVRDKKGFLDGLFIDVYLKAAMGFNSIRNTFAKGQNDEKRPFQVAKDLHYEGSRPQGSSFPSAHTSTAYTAAEVLSRVNQSGTEEYFDDAADVARSRVYLGAHFAGDTAAGASLGVGSAGIFPYVLPSAFAGIGAASLAVSRLTHGKIRTGFGIGAAVAAGLGAAILSMELRNGLFAPASHSTQ